MASFHSSRSAEAIIAVAITALILGQVCLAADDTPKVDMKRAKQLNQRAQQGETLTPDEQAYLDRAKVLREQSPGKPASAATTSSSPSTTPGSADVTGDDAKPQRSPVPGIKISTDLSPVTRFSAKTTDEKSIRAYYRKPPGNGPFPAVLCLHGGVSSASDDTLEDLLLRNPTYTRFLARGFIVVAGDYRSYRETPQARGPVLDCLALTDAVKQMPFVDRESVILFGGSGGGSLALETAASTSLAAIVCGEPATLLFCGMLGDGQFNERFAVLADPQKHYTPERKAQTQAKIKGIKCPVLILHGDKHALKTLNLEIFIPELKAASVDVELKMYPGNPHGFYWGSGTTEKTVEQFMADVDVFLKRCLKTQPKSFAP